MELDAVRTAKLLSRSLDVALLVKRGGYLDQARGSQLDGYRIAVAAIPFRLNLSLSMVLTTRRALRVHGVTDVICFGNSELKSLRLAFIGLGLNVILRHGTTKRRTKRDWFHRWVYGGVHRHVAISAHLARNVEAIYPVESGTDVRLIYPSIPAPPLGSFRRPGPVVRIVHVGRISRGKGEDTAVRGCRALADAGVRFDLTFVGDMAGEEIDSLRAAIAENRLADETRFTGHVADVYRYLSDADVFLFPSRGEGFGNVLAEALCCGLVPIVFDNTALGEIMRLGFYGHLVPDGDERALAEALRHVCEDIENEKRRAYENAARARAFFSEERERKEYLELLAGNAAANYSRAPEQ